MNMKRESEIKYRKVAQEPKAERMSRPRIFRPRIDAKMCERCMFCVAFCPNSCIEVSKAGNPVIDYSCCKGCLICLRECPYGAIIEERE
jgi:2-oxoacid:acceptor oxidoreductase delta subunit (pyruvate/2-ketoisovalerate family)